MRLHDRGVFGHREFFQKIARTTHCWMIPATTTASTVRRATMADVLENGETLDSNLPVGEGKA